MAAPVVVDGETSPVTITDEEGNVVGTTDNPLVTSNPELASAMSELLAENRKLRETLLMIFA